MSILVPSTYYQRNVEWDLVKPHWVPTSQSVAIRISDGEPKLVNQSSGGQSTEGYAVTKEFWEGGYFEFRWRYNNSLNNRTVIGLIDYNSNASSLLRDDFEYGVRRVSGYDIIERGLTNEDYTNVPTNYFRIVISPALNNGLPVYQGSSNGVDWVTAYKSGNNFLYNSDGSPKRLYLAIKYGRLFGGTVQIYDTQVTQRDASFGRTTSYFVDTYEELTNWHIQRNASGSRTFINSDSGSYDYNQAFTFSDSIGGGNGTDFFRINFPELKGGKNPYNFTFRYKRFGNSNGVWFAFMDNNDQMILRVRMGDTQALQSIDDASGNHSLGVQSINNWLQASVHFDWARGKYYYSTISEGGTLMGSLTGDLIHNTNIEYIQVQNQGSDTDDGVDSFVIYDEDVYGYLDYSLDPVTLNSDHMRRFENGSLSGFTINDNNFEIKNYSRRGNNSIGLEETGTTVSDVAVYDPGLPEFSKTFSYARDFPDSGEIDYLDGGNDPDFEIGSNACYFSGWVYIDNINGTSTIAGKVNSNDAADRTFTIYYNSTNGFAFSLHNSSNDVFHSYTSLSIQENVWYFMECLLRPSINEMAINVSPEGNSARNTELTTSFTTPVRTSNGNFSFSNIYDNGDINTLDGAVDSWMFYIGPESDLPTSSQRDAIFNNGNGLTSGQFKNQFSGTSFYDGVVDFFDMSGQGIEVGNINEKLLTENGSVGRVNGVSEETLDISRPYYFETNMLVQPNPGKAAKFEGVSGNRLEAQSNDEFQISGDSFYMATWVKVRDGSNDQHIVTKTGGSNFEWGLYFRFDGFDLVRFYISIDGVSTAIAERAFNGNWLNDWIFLECEYNSSSSTISIYINRSDINTTSVSGTVYDGAFPMTFGEKYDGSLPLDGDIDNTLIFIGPASNLLTQSQRDEIYNNGSGIGWNTFDRKFNGTNFYNGIKGFWELEENGGTRIDSSFNNEDLNEVGSVENTQGIVNAINSGFSLVNSNGDDEMAFFFDDVPSFGIFDANGTSSGLQIVSFGSGMWVTIRVWFHWNEGTYTVYMRQDDTNGGLTTNLYEDYTNPMVSAIDIEKVKFKNVGDSTDWTIGGTSAMNIVYDQIRINDDNI